MSTNFYFNNFPTNQITQEQLLIEDLVIESMQVVGMDVFYLRRTSRDEPDYLWGEDTSKQYIHAYPIEMYMENVTGMDGEGDFISKFGLEIRDELTMLVSRRRFSATIPLLRPQEGDLIYIPLVQNFFEVTFVEHENDQAMFHTLGRGRGGNVYVYGLKLKQYYFSEEIIDTGIEEIDHQAFEHYKRTRVSLANTGTGTYLVNELVYQGANVEFSTASGYVYRFEPNSALDVIRIKGNFISGTNVVGNTSGAIYPCLLENTDTQVDDNTFEDLVNNVQIEQEADDIIDWSESNPFGTP